MVYKQFFFIARDIAPAPFAFLVVAAAVEQRSRRKKTNGANFDVKLCVRFHLRARGRWWWEIYPNSPTRIRFDECPYEPASEARAYERTTASGTKETGGR